MKIINIECMICYVCICWIFLSLLKFLDNYCWKKIIGFYIYVFLKKNYISNVRYLENINFMLKFM